VRLLRRFLARSPAGDTPLLGAAGSPAAPGSVFMAIHDVPNSIAGMTLAAARSHSERIGVHVRGP
jgi:hypothetical protein